jgi:hypothetical protein
MLCGWLNSAAVAGPFGAFWNPEIPVVPANVVTFKKAGVERAEALIVKV